MLNHPALDAGDRERLVMLAEASSERLVTVVKSMLNLARIQAGQFTIESARTDVTAVTGKVIILSTAMAERKDIRLEFHKSRRAIYAVADAAKLGEAMANYVENAVRYSPEGSIIEVDLHQTDGRVVFEVRDQGPGIPPADRRRLFHKFYSRHGSEQGGQGIGLYVVRNIIEKHGGEAYYRPQEKGSTFGFWIPVGNSK